MTTLDLTMLPRASLRMLLVLYLAHHRDAFPAAAVAAFHARLLDDLGWTPTPAESPVSFAALQAWVENPAQVKLRQGLEKHAREEEA